MMKISKRLPLIWFAVAVGILTTCCIVLAARQGSGATTNKEFGSYFPLSVGNWWSYKITGQSKWAGQTQKWTVDDRSFSKGEATYYLSAIPSLGGDAPLGLSSLSNGIVEGRERFVLRYPIHTGNRWSSKSQLYGVGGKLDKFEIVSAGKPCSVGSRSFDDCAAVREIDEALKLFSITTYARGVGPVKYGYFKDVDFKQIDWMLTIMSWGVHS